MSTICICIVRTMKEQGDKVRYKAQIEPIARRWNCGVKFSVDWPEPIVACAMDDSLVVDITDYPGANNCELLLLPDGWYYNGCTNAVPFRDRYSVL